MISSLFGLQILVERSKVVEFAFIHEIVKQEYQIDTTSFLIPRG